jgi:hypothetical protein
VYDSKDCIYCVGVGHTMQAGYSIEDGYTEVECTTCMGTGFDLELLVELEGDMPWLVAHLLTP